MLFFECDYNNGLHPEILEALVKSNGEYLPGYGADLYTQRAKKKILEACGLSEGSVHFIAGGTETNQLVISTLLKPYEGVLAADTGHVSVHEAGAIEYTGHKVLALPGEKGKLKAQELQKYLRIFYADESFEHMVQPGMVYISQPTEYGTLYSRKELEDLHQVTQAYHLPLYVDGARLLYGLASPENDVDLKTLASLCEVFYIGGTKAGTLLGEAVVFTGSNTPAHFMTQIKQHGDLLAKGRVLGVQFDALFTHDLYIRIGQHTMQMAQKLKEILQGKGYRFYMDSPTNQQFVILDNEKLKLLRQQVSFSPWEAYDADHTVVRFATSWSTKEEDLESLKALL